jgi:aspartate/methionine/tyrosine aminotransferase
MEGRPHPPASFQVIEFCHHERLVLMADEVYQENVYQLPQRPFHSFKKILRRHERVGCLLARRISDPTSAA